MQLVEPSYSPLGRALRKTLAAPGTASTDELHRLFTNDRRHQVTTKLRPLLDLARTQPDLALVVIQDRSYYSTAAYQRAHEPIVPTIAEQESFAPRPEVVILLDLPIETALTRHRTRGPQGHDPDTDTLSRARAIYLDMARQFAFDVRDATTPVENLATTLADAYWPKIEAQ